MKKMSKNDILEGILFCSVLTIWVLMLFLG